MDCARQEKGEAIIPPGGFEAIFPDMFNRWEGQKVQGLAELYPVPGAAWYLVPQSE